MGEPLRRNPTVHYTCLSNTDNTQHFSLHGSCLSIADKNKSLVETFVRWYVCLSVWMYVCMYVGLSIQSIHATILIHIIFSLNSGIAFLFLVSKLFESQINITYNTPFHNN